MSPEHDGVQDTAILSRLVDALINQFSGPNVPIKSFNNLKGHETVYMYKAA